MSESLASQVSALAAILQRMERQFDEDRRERKNVQENIKSTLADDRRDADLARSAVSAELTDIRHGQTDVLRRLGRIEPVTDMVTSVRSRVTGGIMLLGVIGGVAWAGLVFFKEIIVGWFQ